MRKTGLWVSLVVVLALALMLVPACAGKATPTPTPALTTPSPAAAPTPAPTPTLPKVTLRAAHHSAPKSTNDLVIQKFKEGVEASSKGGITVEVYPSESLVKGRDALEAVSKGVTDMGLVVFSYWPGDLPFSGAAGLIPFGWGWSTVNQVAKAARPFFDQDLGKYNQKFVLTTIGLTDFMLKKPVDANNPSFKGLKLRSYGGTANMVVEILGGAAVILPSSEMPTALGTGTIDGVITNFLAYDSFDLVKDAPYVYYTEGLLLIGMGYSINNDYFNKLPAQYQKIVLDEAEKASAWLFAESRGLEEAALAKTQTRGAQVTLLTPAQRQVWRDKMQPVYGSLVQKFGQPMQEWLDTIAKIK